MECILKLNLKTTLYLARYLKRELYTTQMKKVMFVSKLHAISVLASRAPSFHLSYTFSTAFSLKKQQSSEASAESTNMILRQAGILLKCKTGRKLAEDVPLR